MRAVNRVSVEPEVIGFCISPKGVELPPIMGVMKQVEADYKPRAVAKAKLKPGLY
jgi:hypothetical protein